jgi:hypothetical protein
VNSTLIASLLTATTIAGGGWGAHEYLTSTYAEKGEVQVAQATAGFVLDRQMEAIIAEISFLERKPHLTPTELSRLAHLRQQLDTMRRVRAGK